MTRTEFYNTILPSSITNLAVDNSNKRKIYNNSDKDIKYIKNLTREKVELDGAPILYFPIIKESNDVKSIDFDNTFQDHTHLKLGKPIEMMASWTPQEYQLDLSKWGVIMPSGSDQQLYLHVDILDEKLKREPLIGDIIETVYDRKRFKIANVFFGNSNFWENIFCMVTLTKVAYDNYTSQLDDYDESYKDTYVALEKTLDITTGKEVQNAEIKKERKKTISKTKHRKKRSLDTEKLDIMTMKL